MPWSKRSFGVAVDSEVSLVAPAVRPLSDIMIAADHVLLGGVQGAPKELGWNTGALLAISPHKCRHNAHAATGGIRYDLNCVLILRSKPYRPNMTRFTYNRGRCSSVILNRVFQRT